MRISTAYQYGSLTDRIRAAQEAYVNAQDKIVSGKNFERPSEDPVGSYFVLDARRVKARIQQLANNLRGAKEYAGLTENAMGDLSDLAKSAYVSAIRGANATCTQDQRASIASEIADLQQRLLDIGNTQGSNQQFIFGGQKSDAKPFSADATGLVFSGDTNAVQADVRVGEAPMRVNQAGSDKLFGDLYNALDSLKNNLMSGNQSAISTTDIANLQASMQQVNVARADAGLKLQTIDYLAKQNQKRMDDLSAQISGVEDVDVAQAVTNYKTAEAAYQAALQVAGQGFKLSLMDYMR